MIRIIFNGSFILLKDSGENVRVVDDLRAASEQNNLRFEVRRDRVRTVPVKFRTYCREERRSTFNGYTYIIFKDCIVPCRSSVSTVGRSVGNFVRITLFSGTSSCRSFLQAQFCAPTYRKDAFSCDDVFLPRIARTSFGYASSRSRKCSFCGCDPIRGLAGVRACWQ